MADLHQRTRTPNCEFIAETFRVEPDDDVPSVGGKRPHYAARAECACGWIGGNHYWKSDARRDWQDNHVVAVGEHDGSETS